MYKKPNLEKRAKRDEWTRLINKEKLWSRGENRGRLNSYLARANRKLNRIAVRA